MSLASGHTYCDIIQRKWMKILKKLQKYTLQQVAVRRSEISLDMQSVGNTIQCAFSVEVAVVRRVQNKRNLLG